jgi:hypothetical protein
MTEAEWLSCEEPGKMLEFLHRRTNARKVRLFAVACCRRLWNLLDDRSRNGVEAAEQYADMQINPERFQASLVAATDAWDDAATLAHQIMDERGSGDDRANAAIHAADAAYRAMSMWSDANKLSLSGDDQILEYIISRMIEASFLEKASEVDRGLCTDHDLWAGHQISEWKVLGSIIHDLVGNPFHLTRIASEWLSWNDGTVVKLAQSIYDARAFDRLPILADALEDAHCANADILAHCRQPGLHVRGCWVIDLLTEKE